jgi:hypothetical protein
MIRVTGLGLGRSATGEATVAMIENGVSAGSAQVTFEHAGTPVRCEVAILASDKPQQPKNLKPASWCIVAAHGPSAERRPDDGDVSDVLCLF